MLNLELTWPLLVAKEVICCQLPLTTSRVGFGSGGWWSVLIETDQGVAVRWWLRSLDEFGRDLARSSWDLTRFKTQRERERGRWLTRSHQILPKLFEEQEDFGMEIDLVSWRVFMRRLVDIDFWRWRPIADYHWCQVGWFSGSLKPYWTSGLAGGSGWTSLENNKIKRQNNSQSPLILTK